MIYLNFFFCIFFIWFSVIFDGPEFVIIILSFFLFFCFILKWIEDFFKTSVDLEISEILKNYISCLSIERDLYVNCLNFSKKFLINNKFILFKVFPLFLLIFLINYSSLLKNSSILNIRFYLSLQLVGINFLKISKLNFLNQLINRLLGVFVLICFSNQLKLLYNIQRSVLNSLKL